MLYSDDQLINIIDDPTTSTRRRSSTRDLHSRDLRIVTGWDELEYNLEYTYVLQSDVITVTAEQEPKHFD